MKPPPGPAVRRLVVKIGSALLVDAAEGAPRGVWLDSLADDVLALRQRGTAVVIVASGAIALGRHRLGLMARDLRLEDKQACAAVGQLALIEAYQRALGRHGLGVAQILLTLEDTEARRRHLNARATLGALLDLGVVPVINENDTVTTAEIRFGDNDRLAARVAQMISADTAILLSDIDGLYTSDPRHDPEARHIARVTEITPAILAMAGDAPPGYSSGGMVTKLEAARIATAAGCRLAIVRGCDLHPLASLDQGARCTWFEAVHEPLTARKRWIAGAVKPSGILVVDQGAMAALRNAKSLLPAGVVRVSGAFERGDAVLIQGLDGERIGCGLVAFSARDAHKIAGHRSNDLAALLGYRGRSAMIHRDDLVLYGMGESLGEGLGDG